MRKNSLLIAIMALLATGCKKDTKEIMISQPPESNYKSICTGNTWSADQYFAGQGNAPTLVYSNKLYAFDGLGGKVRIFDGTSWTTKLSAMPYHGFWDYYFVVGNKGYLGESAEASELYEYDFDANTWKPKAAFPGWRQYQACFTIGSKAYVVAGYYHNETYYSDTWEYNPATNAWTQKASFPLLVFGRAQSTGFAIGNKGYVVNGGFYIQGYNNFYLNSLLQYDPAADAWTIKANFPGEARASCQSFVIGGFAYVGAGRGVNSDNDYVDYTDFYKYNPSTDAWSRIPDFSPLGKFRQSFSINSRGYVTYEFQNNPSNILMEKYTPLSCPSF